MKVDKADLRVVYQDHNYRPLGRLEAAVNWLIDKIFNPSGQYEDGRYVPTWRELRTGKVER